MEQKNSEAARLVTVAELAEFLQVPETWIYERTAKNTIPVVRVGRYVRFSKGQVIAWLSAGGH